MKLRDRVKVNAPYSTFHNLEGVIVDIMDSERFWVSLKMEPQVKYPYMFNRRELILIKEVE